MIRKIARMGHPILKKVAEPVADATAPEIQSLAQDMIETCEEINGNGLAAPQVYESKRLFIYRIAPQVIPAGAKFTPIDWTVVINPKITPLSDEKKLYYERCLSLPGLYGQVMRYVHIRLDATDPEGKRMSYEAKGYHARLLQHEYDHLDGILYPMRMDDMSLLGFVSELGPEPNPIPRFAEDFIE